METNEETLKIIGKTIITDKSINGFIVVSFTGFFGGTAKERAVVVIEPGIPLVITGFESGLSNCFVSFKGFVFSKKVKIQVATIDITHLFESATM